MSHDTEIFQKMKHHSVHKLYGDDGSIVQSIVL